MKAVVIHAPHDIRLDDWEIEAPRAEKREISSAPR